MWFKGPGVRCVVTIHGLDANAWQVTFQHFGGLPYNLSVPSLSGQKAKQGEQQQKREHEQKNNRKTKTTVKVKYLPAQAPNSDTRLRAGLEPGTARPRPIFLTMLLK